ncbi:MAG TPA: DUF4124 domain-containing protein [Usitatibacter sp.]|jgi:hypothetical protein
MRLIAFLALASLSLGVAAQQIYKWTDEKGVAHYSENPPPNVKAVKSGIRADTPAPAPMSPGDAAKKAQDDKVAAQHKAACKAGFMEIMANQNPPFTYNSKGERVPVVDPIRDQKVRAATIQVRKNC